MIGQQRVGCGWADGHGFGAGGRPARAAVRPDVPLLWVKTTDPGLVLPAHDGAQVRVLLPDEDRFAGAATRLRTAGADVRAVGYWVEDETARGTARGELIVRPRPYTLVDQFQPGTVTLRGPDAAAALGACDIVWAAHEPHPTTTSEIADEILGLHVSPGERDSFDAGTTCSPGQPPPSPACRQRPRIGHGTAAWLATSNVA